MNDNQSYERLIKKRVAGKLLLFRILLIAAYVIFELGGSLLVFLFAKEYAALFVLVAALDYCLYLFTWRLTQIEYEYSVVGGSFYLARVLGKASRKELFECELSRATVAAPFSGQYKKDAESISPDKIFRAFSSPSAADIWFIIFETDAESKTMIIFEADEQILRHLRRGCPRAVAREKLTAAKAEKEN